jgi:hypothetical protein
MKASLFEEQSFVAVRLSIIRDTLLDTLLRCCQAKKLKRPPSRDLVETDRKSMRGCRVAMLFSRLGKRHLMMGWCLAHAT